MGASPTSPKVSHTYAQILTRFGRTGEIPDDYDPPEELQHVWSLFWHFSYRRKSAEGNAFAIEYGEIFAYTQCTGERLTMFEVDAIVAMDDSFREQLAKTRDHQRSFNETKQDSGPPTKKPRSRSIAGKKK